MATVKSLKRYVDTKLECFNEYERQGAEKSGTTEYVQTRQRRRYVQTRQRRRYVQTRQRIRYVRLNPLDYGRAPETELSPSQRFCAENYIPVVDQCVSSLEQRLSAYELICFRFGFLGQVEKLSPEEIHDAANIYKDDRC